MKFEQNWSVERVGTPVYGWEWDSMQAAHILDNRKGITGLKFQAYVNFGLIDYDSHIEGWLKGGGEQGANSINKVRELVEKKGPDELLTYCGLDSLLEFKLAEIQRKELGFG